MNEPAARGKASKSVLWIAATPRSGSNLLCELLFERAEIKKPREFLSQAFLRKHHALDDEGRLVVPSLDVLLDQIAHVWHDTGHPICIKAFYIQFGRARRLPGVRESLSRHPVVMLVRRDVVAQAVSHYIARSTGRWISDASQGRDPETVAYDFDAIDSAAGQIERDNALWRRTFLVCGIEYREIYYEDLIAKPADVVGGVMHLWALEPRSQAKAVHKPHARQTTALNAQFIEQYCLDKANGIFGAGLTERRT